MFVAFVSENIQLANKSNAFMYFLSGRGQGDGLLKDAGKEVENKG